MYYIDKLDIIIFFCHFYLFTNFVYTFTYALYFELAVQGNNLFIY